MTMLNVLFLTLTNLLFLHFIMVIYTHYQNSELPEAMGGCPRDEPGLRRNFDDQDHNPQIAM